MIEAWFNNMNGAKSTKGTEAPLKKQESGEKSRVWVTLTDEDKLYCKRMARKLKDDGVLLSSTYSDYIEYLIKTTKSQNL